MRYLAALGLLVLAATSAQAAQSKHTWKPVPGHKGVFVDMASIRHVPVIPARDENHLPGPDTLADILVNGHLAQSNAFYCSRPEIEFGDATFGEFLPGGPPKGVTLGVVPMKASRAVVCAEK